MRVHVAFTPGEPIEADVAIVVDVMRATSTIAQALASGYRRVLCCSDIDEARALREEIGDAVLGGEREAIKIPGFDLGASPRDYLQPRAETAIMTTTNGTRAIVTAAARCGTVLIGSLLNLDAVAKATAGGGDVVILCAGFQGTFAVDDAYCAGRIVELLKGDRTDPAVGAAAIARAFPTAWEGVNARTYGPPGLEDDLKWCTQENTLDVVPRLARIVGSAAEVIL